MGNSREQTSRVELTRQRHGADFYTRIGRKSLELRRRARAGDPEVLAILARRRAARRQRRAAWLAVLEAREAVVLLREELITRSRANADPACALHMLRYRYTDQLRLELAEAERRLALLQEEHKRLLHELHLPLDSAHG